MPLPIETARLILRKYEGRDLMDIVEYSTSSDYCLSRNLDWKPTREDAKKHWETQQEFKFEDDPQ